MWYMYYQFENIFTIRGGPCFGPPPVVEQDYFLRLSARNSFPSLASSRVALRARAAAALLPASALAESSLKASARALILLMISCMVVGIVKICMLILHRMC